MAYDFEKDKSAKSFELELDNDTIMTAFITTDEEADGTLPKLDTGVYGGIGYGPMSPDFEFLNSGGGGSSDLSIATLTIITLGEPEPDASPMFTPTIPMLANPNIQALPPEITSGIVSYMNLMFNPQNREFSVQVPLYDGKLYIDAANTDIVLSGNIASDNNGIVITGDCTMTYDYTR